MATATITIQVDEAAARAFEAAPAEDQRKMELLLSLRLRDITADVRRDLKAVMDEIGAQAEALGLTPDSLESLLHDE